MSCNCKNNQNIDLKKDSTNKNNIISYIVNFIIFLFSICLIPLLIPFIIWVLFKTIVFNNNINLFPLLLKLGLSLKNKKETIDNDINLDNNDLELDGVDIIK